MKKTWPLLVAVAFLTGCSVIVPVKPTNSPAYDGPTKDSGIVGVLADNDILVTGYVKTSYESLVKVYGDDFVTPLTGDEGVFDPIPGKYYHVKDKDHPGQFILYTADPNKVYYEIDAEHAVKYLDMCDWSNSGIDPASIDPHGPAPQDSCLDNSGYEAEYSDDG